MNLINYRIISNVDTKKYDFVICGGGIVGISMAYWLAKRGAKSIALLEKDIALGNGSTGKCAGGIRAQFSTEVNIKIQLLAIKIYENFKNEIGGDPEFHQPGYLFMIKSEGWKHSFQKSVQIQRKLGLPVKELAPSDIKKLAPYVNTDGLIYGTFCKTDGYADPHGTIQGFWDRCKEMAVDIFMQTEVNQIKKNGANIISFVTNNGEFKGDVFINCAGAWSGELGKMTGAEIPVTGVRRMLFITNPIEPSPDGFPVDIPMTIDMDTGVYLRRESGGLLLGMEDESEPPGFDTTLNWDFLNTLIEHAIHRIPKLGECEIMRGWGGLYDMSPDRSAVVGLVPGFKNFYVVSGFSGHGFMQGPATTKLLSELIIDGKPSIDISQLRVDRFKDGEQVYELNVI